MPTITAQTRTVVDSVTMTLSPGDAKVLRTMLGGLRRKVRREAVKANGGGKDSANRARFLVKEIIDAFEAQGITRLDEVPVTDSAPDINGDEYESDTDYPTY